MTVRTEYAASIRALVDSWIVEERVDEVMATSRRAGAEDAADRAAEDLGAVLARGGVPVADAVYAVLSAHVRPSVSDEHVAAVVRAALTLAAAHEGLSGPLR